MTGTIIALNGSVGGASSAQQSGGSGGSSNFVQLADLTKLQVNASVPEADATRLKVGQPATITWNALTNTSAKGQIVTVSPTSSGTGNVVSYPIVAGLDTIPQGVKLGQSVKIGVTVGSVENAVFVPSAAIRAVGGRNTVTVVADGKQEIRLVQIGLKGDSATVVTEGLAVGEQVVLATSTTGNTNQLPGGGLFPGGGGPGGGIRQGGPPQGGGGTR
jgi:macrolide-specific efflux system membrane fusion protein